MQEWSTAPIKTWHNTFILFPYHTGVVHITRILQEVNEVAEELLFMKLF